MEKPLSKFADNLEDLAERTAEYIRRLEEENLRLREEKNYFLHKAGENIAEIAELKERNKFLSDTLDLLLNTLRKTK